MAKSLDNIAKRIYSVRTSERPRDSQPGRTGFPSRDGARARKADNALIRYHTTRAMTNGSRSERRTTSSQPTRQTRMRLRVTGRREERMKKALIANNYPIGNRSWHRVPVSGRLLARNSPRGAPEMWTRSSQDRLKRSAERKPSCPAVFPSVYGGYCSRGFTFRIDAGCRGPVAQLVRAVRS